MESDVYAGIVDEVKKGAFSCSKKNVCTVKRGSYRSTLVCINCGIPYHLGCIVRLKNIKYIKGNLISCCNNRYESQAGDKQNENDARIQEINKLQESLQHALERYKYYKEAFLQQEQLIKTLKTADLNHVDKETSSNEYNDDSSSKEIDLLNEVNQLLKEKNNLLIEKNLYLEQEIKNLKEKPINTISYANILKNQANLNINNKPADLIIKPIKKDNKNSTETKNDIIKNVDLVSLKISSATIKKKLNGTVILKCKNESDLIKIQKELDSKIKDKYEMVPQFAFKPRIKIIGDFNNNNLDDLEKIIYNQNFAEIEGSHFKALHMWKNPIKNYSILYAEVNKKTYSHISTTKRISLQFKKFKVYDDFNLLKCHKCCKYGHIKKWCKNETACFKCSKPHEANDCKETIKHCVNCSESNERFNTEYNCEHYSTDRSCNNKLKIDKKIAMTDYEDKPNMTDYYIEPNTKLTKNGL